MPTETKSYTPGAERAATLIAHDWIPINEGRVAEIISRETHDAEMLGALKATVNLLHTYGFGHETDTILMGVLRKAEAIIAKVEGQ